MPRGGKREGAGRKAISPENKKVNLNFVWVTKSTIEELGKDKIKELCCKAIKKHLKEIKS